jgi:hypothetical protein
MDTLLGIAAAFCRGGSGVHHAGADQSEFKHFNID